MDLLELRFLTGGPLTHKGSRPGDEGSVKITNIKSGIHLHLLNRYSKILKCYLFTHDFFVF